MREFIPPGQSALLNVTRKSMPLTPGMNLKELSAPVNAMEAPSTLEKLRIGVAVASAVEAINKEVASSTLLPKSFSLFICQSPLKSTLNRRILRVVAPSEKLHSPSPRSEENVSGALRLALLESRPRFPVALEPPTASRSKRMALTSVSPRPLSHLQLSCRIVFCATKLPFAGGRRRGMFFL